jgi:hypothetical protein
MDEHSREPGPRRCHFGGSRCQHSDTQELPECSAGAVTIIIGPRGVGKSSVSWGLAMRRWDSGECTVYVDLDQVGFLRPAPSDAWLQAANLAVIWRNALSRGASRPIANGMVTTNEDLAILRHAVRPAPVQALRLAANPDTLWERIRARSAGSPSRLVRTSSTRHPTSAT